MIITFVGHSDVYINEELYLKVKVAINDIAEKNLQITFYNGAYGDFDNLCARVCYEVKSSYKKCENVFVTPYLTEKYIQERMTLGEKQLFNSVLYPPIERTPPKFAISKRNEWMISEADVVISYVTHKYGGAYRSLLFAKRLGKTIINLAKIN